MIRGVGNVAVLVRDPQRSAEWYRDKLGFEIVGNVGHAVFVRPRGADGTLVHLCGPCDGWKGDSPGGRTGIWLACGEIRLSRNKKTGMVLPSSDPEAVERTYQELQAKGVEFSEPLTTVDWGKYAIMKDLDGNEFEIS
jgi:lactoylglutathione lyase